MLIYNRSIYDHRPDIFDHVDSSNTNPRPGPSWIQDLPAVIPTSVEQNQISRLAQKSTVWAVR